MSTAQNWESEVIALLEYTAKKCEDEMEQDVGIDLGSTLQPIHSTQVRYSCGKSSDGRQAFFLPSLPKGKGKGTRAILRIVMKDGAPNFEVSLVQNNEEGSPVAHTFRFEHPESNGDDGTPSSHRYFHTQLVFDRSSLPQAIAMAFAVRSLPFSPDQYPAVPLPATNSQELLICALVSLYGTDFFYSWAINIDEVRDTANNMKKKLCVG